MIMLKIRKEIRYNEYFTLVPLIKILTFLCFILPLLRLCIFRTMEIIIPTSLLNATFLLLALLVTILRGKLLIGRNVPVLLCLIVLPASAYIISIENASMNDVFTSLWVYLVNPMILIVLGNMSAARKAPPTEVNVALRCRVWLRWAMVAFLTGVLLNALDIILLGHRFYNIYAEYATAQPSLIFGSPLPRLSGAYFSGIDLSLAAILLLTLRRAINGRFFTSANVVLLVVIFLTLTRNSYIVFIAWLLVQKFSKHTISRAGSLAFITMPAVSLLVVFLIQGQASNGSFEVNDLTSSVWTRIVSWAYIVNAMLSDGGQLVLGLGITQNMLEPGVSKIYAIDNYFWELMSFGGILAFICHGLFLKLIRGRALRKSYGVGQITLILVAVLPVAGLFNNMVGSSLMGAIFLSCGVLFSGASRSTSRRHFSTLVLEDLKYPK